MSTLAQLRSRIADDLNRTDLNTQIDTAINRAIEYYNNREDFWFSETTATFSTVANQEEYGVSDGIPDDIADIDRLELILTSTNKPEIFASTFEWLKDVNVGQGTGQPTDYAFYQSKIYLYLIPNQVYTIKMYYKKTYDELVSDSETNDYTVYARDLIEARASYWLYSRVLKDAESAAMSKTEENDALNALRNRSAKMVMTTNQIQATKF